MTDFEYKAKLGIALTERLQGKDYAHKKNTLTIRSVIVKEWPPSSKNYNAAAPWYLEVDALSNKGEIVNTSFDNSCVTWAISNPFPSVPTYMKSLIIIYQAHWDEKGVRCAYIDTADRSTEIKFEYYTELVKKVKK